MDLDKSVASTIAYVALLLFALLAGVAQAIFSVMMGKPLPPPWETLGGVVFFAMVALALFAAPFAMAVLAYRIWTGR